MKYVYDPYMLFSLVYNLCPYIFKKIIRRIIIALFSLEKVKFEEIAYTYINIQNIYLDRFYPFYFVSD